jgi:ribosomal protein S24E
MKVMIFHEGNTTELRNMINKWLAEHPGISINTILQSESDAGGFALTITIFYLDFSG